MLPPTPRPTPALPTLFCEHYDYLECRGSSAPCNNSVQACEVDPEGKQPHCYALWTNKSGTVVVSKKGCWFNLFECLNPAVCISEAPVTPEQHQFCCCDTDTCNVNVYTASWISVASSPTTTTLYGETLTLLIMRLKRQLHRFSSIKLLKYID